MFDTLNPCTIPPEDEALRPHIRALAAETVARLPAETRARSWSGLDIEFSHRLGREGFLGLTLPKEYGGAGRGPFARFVVVEELLAVGAPVAAHWIADRQSAPLILNYGTEAQRKLFLPKIASGEIFFCIGMSEPNSGSDLASVRTRAEKISTGWVLNGQKIWTTNALHADYMIALIRTSGTVNERQAGLSQLLVPLKAKGVTVRPITDLTGASEFAEVFFDNVKLDEDALVGKEGQGWDQATAELAFERSGPERIYSSLVLIDTWVQHLRRVGRIIGPAAQLAGEFTGKLMVLRAMSLAVTGQLAAGESPVIEASLIKDLGTSYEQEVPALIAEDIGSHPDEEVSVEFYRTLNFMSRIAPSFSLRGGTREILRGIIARGLGLR